MRFEGGRNVHTEDKQGEWCADGAGARGGGDEHATAIGPPQSLDKLIKNSVNMIVKMLTKTHTLTMHSHKSFMAPLEVLGCGDVEPGATTQAGSVAIAAAYRLGIFLWVSVDETAGRCGARWAVRCSAITHQAFTSQDLNEDAIEMYAIIHCSIMLNIALLTSITTVSDAGSSNAFAPHSMHAVWLCF
jgi:hypothetical protein